MSRGGEWLTGGDAPSEIFTPEKLSDEHRLIAQTASEFVAKEVIPAIPRLEQKDWSLSRSLLKRCGDLGLIGTDVPERVGGVGLDKVAAVVVTEAIGAYAGFATAFGAQSGLAIIPILCFGTEDQQQKYLPLVLSGELVGAYCLSESGSGSDALAARARATRADDGSWRLNGEKMWTTNGGFADLFIVFAKVDGEEFSAFIVERSFPGVSTGKEEHKMGLHGSSTTPLLLQDAHVPAANALGPIGRGHKIAFNVLNYGRFKLAAMCTGAAKTAIAEAATYATQRRQFGKSIASFGAIRHKLAEMTVQLYAAESMLYRTAGLLDDAIAQGDGSGAALAAALEEFAIEASLVKVASSEMLDFVLDENVQIHGGNGFVHDYAAEREYRDARANRIFEGTNEINRLLVPTMLIKRGIGTRGEGRGAREQGNSAAAIRRVGRLLLEGAREKFGDRLADEQEVLMLIADVLIDAFAADSVIKRATAAERAGQSNATLHADAATTFVHDAMLRVHVITQTLMREDLGGELPMEAFDTIAARRRIAEVVMTKKGYAFLQ